MHGEAEAAKARTASDALFGGDASNIEGVPTFEVSASLVNAGINIVDLMMQSGLATSKSEARRLITGGGAYVNEEKITVMDKMINSADVKDGIIMLRSGKKNYLKVLVK
jgi:tyrosyl-tRNA synthetase